jgi:hypothetical protein
MQPASDFHLTLAHYRSLFDELNAARDERMRLEQELESLGGAVEEYVAEASPSAIRIAISQFERELAAIDEQHAALCQTIDSRLAIESDAAHASYRNKVAEAERQAANELARVETKFQEDCWMVSSILDDKSDASPQRQLEKLATLVHQGQEKLTSQDTELESLVGQMTALQEERRQAVGDPPNPGPAATGRDAALQAAIDAAQIARDQAALMGRDLLPRLLDLRILTTVGVLLWLCLGGTLFATVPPTLVGLSLRPGFEWPLIAGGIGFGLSCILLLVLHTVASGRFAAEVAVFQQAIVDARAHAQHWQKLARQELKACEQEFTNRQAAIAERRERSLQQFETARDGQITDIESRRTRTLCDSERQRDAELQLAAEGHNDELLAAEVAHRRETTALRTRHEREMKELNRSHQQDVAERNIRRRDVVERIETLRRETLAWFGNEAAKLADESRRTYPEWDAIALPEWQAAETIPAGIRLGDYAVPAEPGGDTTRGRSRVRQERGSGRDDPHSGECGYVGGLPENLGLPLEADRGATAPPVTELLPAVLPFPEAPSLLLKFAGMAGKAPGVSILQTAMLRLLTQLPPGDLRFTIIDAQGLGENFAAFMHLADYDELLISSRIWTEQAHIDQQLANLTEHMENVFQKYLRNEYSSIEEYNHHAGEVAEPYRILVVANFPAGFSERAAQRLVSIVTSGARCGVHTFISVDTRQPLPRGFDLSQLESATNVLSWEGEHFVNRTLENVAMPLAADLPPGPALWAALIRKMGELSRHIRRVEVPFHRIAPREEACWTEDSRSQIEVPLGRAGATKLQYLRLGRGTSQHVLAAGKTGSGKSTLLHIILVNLALRYSPDEIEFYLIDFKKGVEFKTYATHHLPHARVISIESDREFAVSTLERLDTILKERGDQFRRAGVQDIASFRDACPGEPMPRILFMVDEFQEFFVEDDRYSQTAGLLLDRLVRQGRAFGIHVLLGSQTLGGAYSLARTTIGQMAVRIALQCSDTDAHLILSEDNTAARLLTRPGEAIYNDANGMLEGNNPFQVAWLGDDQRDVILERIETLATDSGRPRREAIVFEGNIPADPSRNAELCTLIEAAGSAAEATPDANVAPRAWLGDAVAITGPTSVIFSRRSGANLLLVGADEAASRGILQTVFLALAAQTCRIGAEPSADEASAEEPPTNEPTVLPGMFLFCETGAHNGSEDAGPCPWSRLAELVPDRAQICTPDFVGQALESLAAEVGQRRQSRTPAPSLFLLIDDLSRFRDLRKSDDDFGFGSSSRETKPAPGKLFSEVLREGPAVGIHVLIWCDTYNNVDRWFSRQLLREFEMRVLLQMSAADSSQLIDSPVASRLGANRAILFSDERGTLEKFRPYGQPSDAWLDWLRHTLSPATTTDHAGADDIDLWMVS